MFVLTWTFARQTRSRWLVVSSALFAGAALSLLQAGEGPWVGVMRRLLVTMIAGWLIMVALRLPAIASARRTTANRKVSEMSDGHAL